MRRLRLLEPWRSRVLWASLAANVFLVALLAAPHVLAGHPHGPPRFEAIVDRLARGMGPDDASRFRATMAAERPAYDADRALVYAARRTLATQLIKQPYDPEAAMAALSQMQARMQETATRFNASMAHAVGEMSPAGRAQVAQFLDRAGPR